MEFINFSKIGIVRVRYFMKLKFFAIICLSSSLLLSGLGCNKTDTEAVNGKQVQLDTSLKIFIDKPDGWEIKKFNTLYKNPKTPSGYTYVSGGINYGLGPVDEKGDTNIKVQIIAVPKAYIEAYEKGRYPVNAERKLETGEYVVYSAIIDPKDSQVESVLKSLVLK